MKKLLSVFGILLFTSFILTSCGSKSISGGKSTEECKDDIKSYQFGGEMRAWVSLRGGGLSLDVAIREYSDGLGIDLPYKADNPCVIRGFEDAMEGKISPYEK